MSIVYSLSQNPVGFLDATTLVEPPNTIEVTNDIVKGIFDPLGMQLNQPFANFGPQRNETLLFPAPRANIVAIVQIKKNNNEGLGALQLAFGHPGIGNEDIIYVIEPTDGKNYVIVLFSPDLRDRFRVFNSSFSSYSINVSVIDGIRIPASSFGPSGTVIIDPASIKDLWNAKIANNNQMDNRRNAGDPDQTVKVQRDVGPNPIP